MIVQILGIIDIIIGTIFGIQGLGQWLNFSLFAPSILIVLGVFLIVKGILFIWGWDPLSILDIVCGLILISSTIFGFPIFIFSIVGIYLIIKGAMSLVG